MEPTNAQTMAEVMRLQAQITSLRDELPRALAGAVAEGVREGITDDEMMHRFSRALYDELASHAVNNTSQWIGKRILTAAVVALTTAGIIWLVKSGALK